MKTGDNALFGPLKTPCRVLSVHDTSMDMDGFRRRLHVEFESGYKSTKWEWELTPAPEPEPTEEQTS